MFRDSRRWTGFIGCGGVGAILGLAVWGSAWAAQWVADHKEQVAQFWNWALHQHAIFYLALFVVGCAIIGFLMDPDQQETN